jgi:hypothetical protein
MYLESRKTECPLEPTDKEKSSSVRLDLSISLAHNQDTSDFSGLPSLVRVTVDGFGAIHDSKLVEIADEHRNDLPTNGDGSQTLEEIWELLCSKLDDFSYAMDIISEVFNPDVFPIFCIFTHKL